LKRCVALGGAKNHLFVLPDANPAMTATNVTASMTGCAGQRCMAASAMLAVGDVDPIIEQICDEARKVVPGKNLGAVISKAAKERIESYITEAEHERGQGSGRRPRCDGRRKGKWHVCRPDSYRSRYAGNVGRQRRDFRPGHLDHDAPKRSMKP
jgi:malonate-semialdehyde dehydrogenase (acetylating)/methylmalonate-semialdehyde dehydrogenase